MDYNTNYQDEPSEEKGKVIKWLNNQVENFTVNSYPSISAYVLKLREQNPNITNEKLANKIVNRKSLKNGLIGAATSVGGFLTLPVTIPADLIATWRIQIYLTLTIAHVFGHSGDTTDLKTDIFIMLAGNSAKEVLKKVGVETGKEVTKRTIKKHITREIMKKIWHYIPQKIITKGGEKSLISFSRMVPLVGAPIGFAFDYIATKAVGKTAIKYYKN